MNNQKTVLNNKWVAAIIIFLCIGIFYIKLLSYNILKDESEIIQYIVNLFGAILLLYSTYVFTNILEYIILKITKLVNIRFFVIYPFVFDKTISFCPIKLLYNEECVRDVFPQNLLFEYASNQSILKIKEKFKTIRLIREGLLLISLLLLTIILKYLFGWNFILEISFVYILLLLLSFTTTGFNWMGNRRIIINNKFEEYFLSIKYCDAITNDKYSNYLSSYYKDINTEVLLKILENYLLSALQEEVCFLPIDEVKAIINIIELSDVYEALYGIKKMQAKKLIGLVGMQTKNEEYRSYGIELILNDINDLSNYNISSINNKAIKNLIEYKSFLQKDIDTIEPSKHLALGMNNLFSFQNEIEVKIKKILKNSN